MRDILNIMIELIVFVFVMSVSMIIIVMGGYGGGGLKYILKTFCVLNGMFVCSMECNMFEYFYMCNWEFMFSNCRRDELINIFNYLKILSVIQ